jgi:hypothetical protein
MAACRRDQRRGKQLAVTGTVVPWRLSRWEPASIVGFLDRIDWIARVAIRRNLTEIMEPSRSRRTTRAVCKLESITGLFSAKGVRARS